MVLYAAFLLLPAVFTDRRLVGLRRMLLLDACVELALVLSSVVFVSGLIFRVRREPRVRVLDDLRVAAGRGGRCRLARPLLQILRRAEDVPDLLVVQRVGVVEKVSACVREAGRVCLREAWFHLIQNLEKRKEENKGYQQNLPSFLLLSLLYGDLYKFITS